MNDTPYHVPVMPDETIDSLAVDPNGIYVDGTAGGGGHSALIADRLASGKLYCIDRDRDARKVLSSRFADAPNVIVIGGLYGDMAELLAEKGVTSVSGVLLDIGVSSHQLDDPGRGFSFHNDAPLDMRMGRGPDANDNNAETAAELVNTLSWQALAEIFSKYGEEKFSPRVAKAICAAREGSPIETTGRLAEIIASAYPAAARRSGHPARQVFQALRIAVNDELGELDRGLDGAFSLLKPGGRLSVITFHSLEDRMVKRRMAEWARGCTCPPDCPVCICGNLPKAVPLNKKPLEPSEDELESNPRSRSAKLRTIVKL
ncbi:MAG: 16S rRNA (cytosine(1402)-N(4))-methyltransferase RsmH [Oscillospiraceae bacterium]|nr:16S rRNA (cytosine(1402)-N(4))-methyltransferase RsmH [Oscillospiraceae bacterium]